MPICDSFQRQLESLEPTPGFESAAERHIAAVRNTLAGAIALNRLDVVGSYKRGTFIRGRSDVDMFARLNRKATRWGENDKLSRTVLLRLKKFLRDRFPTSSLVIDGHAVVL